MPAALSRAGFRIPDFLCVTAEAYNAFLDGAGLRERILLELHRKDFKEMRWEEIWDCATRIRNLFLRKPLPPGLAAALHAAAADRFGGRAVVVRSSAPDEDAMGSSFAGLHESFVNIRGAEAVVVTLPRDGGRIEAGTRHSRCGRVEQHHVLALQACLAVRGHNELRDGIMDRLGGADMQHGLPARLFDAQLGARGRRDASRAGAEAEAVCKNPWRGVEDGNRGVQRLPEL
mgnify:CR=1 FL=1